MKLTQYFFIMAIGFGSMAALAATGAGKARVDTCYEFEGNKVKTKGVCSVTHYPQGGHNYSSIFYNGREIAIAEEAVGYDEKTMTDTYKISVDNKVAKKYFRDVNSLAIKDEAAISIKDLFCFKTKSDNFCYQWD